MNVTQVQCSTPCHICLCKQLVSSFCIQDWQMQPITTACLQLQQCNICNIIVVCRNGAWSASSWQHYICCLSCVLHNPSVQHRLTESTQRHQRRRNGISTWHRRLPWWSTAVHRRLELYLACISWWSVVREVADDWWVIPLPLAVTDVTSTAGDVIPASTSVQHDQQTSTTCCLNATGHVPVPWCWDNTWYVCHRSPRYCRGQGAGRSEWTSYFC